MTRTARTPTATAERALDGPADTRMMGIVHNALRRDLVRVREVVATDPAPIGRQRRALGEHVVWLMDFLHDHHAGEDAGLWPLVRDREPAAAALLDSLEADHQRIAPAVDLLAAAGRRYATTTGEPGRRDLLDALDGLAAVLFPHLDREVAEGMLVVSAVITEHEWREWDQAYNLKGKSLRRLGLEGHWLLDGIDPVGHQLVVQLVPPIPRFVLLHGFRGVYRRWARARWER